jgi:hypothetical protein
MRSTKENIINKCKFLRDIGDENRSLYVGRAGLFGSLLGMAFLASLISSIHVWSLSGVYNFSEAQIASYRDFIPVISDIELSIKAGHLSKKKGHEIINIVAFFYTLLVYVIPPIFSIWLFFLIRSVPKNIPYVYSDKPPFRKNDLVRLNRQLIALSIPIIVSVVYVLFYYCKPYVEENYYFHVSGMFLLIFGVGCIAAALSNLFLPSFKITNEKASTPYV